MIEGFYTAYTKAVVYNPRNVMTLRDIQCHQYMLGSGTKFFGSMSNETSTSAKIMDDLQKRLTWEYEDSDGSLYCDMLVFASPADEPVTTLDNALSITSLNFPYQRNDVRSSRISSTDETLFPGGADLYNAYNKLLNLDGWVLAGRDVTAAVNDEYLVNGRNNNSFCFVGPHRKYAPFTQTFYDLTPGQGHFGPDALPGDKRWRNGETVTMQNARNALQGVEAIQQSRFAMNMAHA